MQILLRQMRSGKINNPHIISGAAGIFTCSMTVGEKLSRILDKHSSQDFAHEGLGKILAKLDLPGNSIRF